MGIKLNTDRIIGLSAMLISLLTLIIFIYQTNLIRKQSRLSVTPRIAFETSLDSKDSLSVFIFGITNKGLGPAIIEHIEILHDGKQYKLDFHDFFNEVFPNHKSIGNIVQNMTLDTGTTLAEKETIKFLTYVFPTRKTQELMALFGVKNEDEMPFDIEMVYSSIYEEKWKATMNGVGHPIKL